MIKAIETKYKGYRFRSRLEARWAVLFDKLNIKWDYEPEGYHLPDGTMYLPDFYLKDFNIFIEIKGKEANKKEMRKISLLAGKIKSTDLFITADLNLQKILIEKYIDFSYGNIELFNATTGAPASYKDKFLMSAQKISLAAREGRQGIMFDRGLDGFGWLCGKKNSKDTMSIEINKFNVMALLSGCASEEVLMAFNAAKSARFEHGEKG